MDFNENLEKYDEYLTQAKSVLKNFCNFDGTINQTATFYKDIIKLDIPFNYLEIGSGEGGSLFSVMAEYPNCQKLYGCEPNFNNVFYRNLERLNLDRREMIKDCRDTSNSVLTTIRMM